ncbi:glycosyltransferase family A protein [Motiliproteus sp. MSK22-1]|uniref:glycosyltransferase family 2 protein n=1 Tax=Motiliproteus sp. MSK22-1 TaxID=1897630 RepID=UPI000976B7C0|nr:glycosyltransferase family A protein [Motiliproteus sp. MSK22-1]OMH25681.1 hypothetical protein BGP75_24380 [Motiliproteus sp. MSK22-1]
MTDDKLNNYEISVVIPYYNADDFFDECINSILNQTCRAKQIIIVNDGSHPRSIQYLEQYKSVAEIIHLDKGQGVASARNIALGYAKYPWIAFQDADDIWEPNKLELQIEALNSHPEWIGCHTGVLTFDKTGTLNTYCNKPSPLKVTDLLQGSHMTPPSLLIKKSVIEELGFFDTSFTNSSDYDFSILLTKNDYLLGFVPEPLIRVRRSDHGNISSFGYRTLRCHIKLVFKHSDIFIRVGRLNSTRRFLAKSLSESGAKIGGIKGATLYKVGRLLGL